MASEVLQAAEIFGRHNIPTLPIGEDKKPLVRNFKIAELTLRQSRAFFNRRADAGAIGVPNGPLSGIVVLDIDDHDSNVAREAIKRAGSPGAVVRTASGRIHLWYADNGEKRLTGKPGSSIARPWDDLRIDLCGANGYTICPPSQFSGGGEYRFENEVKLEDILRCRSRMPKIRDLPERAYSTSSGLGVPSALDSKALSRMRDGSGRNPTLFHALLRQAPGLPKNLDAYLDWSRTFNVQFAEPMAENEVVKVAKSVFGYAETGQLRTGKHGAWFEQSHAQALARDPYLLALLVWLKAENGSSSEFFVADGLASPTYLDWPRERLKEARRRAVVDGWILQIRKPFPGSPALYRWGSKIAGV